MVSLPHLMNLFGFHSSYCETLPLLSSFSRQYFSLVLDFDFNAILRRDTFEFDLGLIVLQPNFGACAILETLVV